MSSTSANVLGDKDTNAPVQQTQPATKDVRTMEYHRQVFQSKIQEPSQTYVSPSDVMSPCTQKISALRNKHASKAKPKSLFAQASAKKIGGDNALGATPARP